MFCTFCYHGDCHVEQVKPVRVCVCAVHVCARSRAISRAQILKLFSEETTAKGATPTIPSLVCSRFLFSLPLIFLILHPYFSPPPSSRSPSLSLPSRSTQPLPCCASHPTPQHIALVHPMATARRRSEEETDRRRLLYFQ